MSAVSCPEILAQSDSWIVVAKPAGWLTIPGRAAARPEPGHAPAPGVVSQWLEGRLNERIWVVHRIDRETSGLLLFARSQEAHRLANRWFEKHQVKKSYDFIAMGNPVQPIFKVNSPIEGLASVTQVEVRERWGVAFLGRATPLSGRRHQIRIHLSGKGHPLLGDVRYGGARHLEPPGLTIERVALHAARLELPAEGDRPREIFEASWPEDFRSWVERLRESKKVGEAQ